MRHFCFILVIFSYAQFSHGQTNYLGNTIWPLFESPSFKNRQLPTPWNSPAPSQYVSFFELGLHGNMWAGRWGLRYNNITNRYDFGGGAVPHPQNSQQIVLVNRTGTNLTISIDGIQRYQASTNAVLGINRLVLEGTQGGANCLVDNFHYNGSTNTFSSTNSPDWQFYKELELPNVNYINTSSTPLTLPDWQRAATNAISGITGGRMHLRSGITSQLWGKSIANFNTPLSGDFTLGFTVSRDTPGFGNFYLILVAPSRVTTPRTGGGVVRPASVTTLRRRFNRTSGKMEVLRNGVLTHRGFLKFRPNARLNRRQILRGYRNN